MARKETFALTDLGLLVLGILWPPELSAGLAKGIREFRKASEAVIRELLGDDDDDGPSAA